MSEWKTYKLCELCKITSSKRIFANEYTDFGVPFYRGKEIIEKQKGNRISTELFISQERYDEIKMKYGVPQIGDMLLTSVGTLGIPYIVEEEMFYFKDGNLTWFYDFDELYSRFLYYWFLSPIGKANIDSKAIGSTQKALTITTLSKFEISLPPLAEQKRIADILSAIDDKIELNRRINTNLEQQAQALYKSWFVDFEPFGGKMPEDWRVGTLGEICITNKRSYSGKFYNSFEYLDTGSVTSNKIDTIQLLNPTIDKIPSRARRAVTEGDILYSSVRPNQKHYMFLYNPSSNMVVSTGFIVITANWSGYRYYIYQYLIQDIVIQHLQSIAEQSVSTYPSINASDITNLEINIPSNKAIEKYANVMNPIMKQITNNQSENLRLAQLRDTLLPKLMSGEITV